MKYEGRLDCRIYLCVDGVPRSHLGNMGDGVEVDGLQEGRSFNELLHLKNVLKSRQSDKEGK